MSVDLTFAALPNLRRHSPNILIFTDHGWNELMAERQQMRLDTWLAGVNKLVVIEIGEGENIPTIRDMG